MVWCRRRIYAIEPDEHSATFRLFERRQSCVSIRLLNRIIKGIISLVRGPNTDEYEIEGDAREWALIMQC